MEEIILKKKKNPCVFARPGHALARYLLTKYLPKSMTSKYNWLFFQNPILTRHQKLTVNQCYYFIHGYIRNYKILAQQFGSDLLFSACNMAAMVDPTTLTHAELLRYDGYKTEFELRVFQLFDQYRPASPHYILALLNMHTALHKEGIFKPTFDELLKHIQAFYNLEILVRGARLNDGPFGVCLFFLTDLVAPF